MSISMGMTITCIVFIFSIFVLSRFRRHSIADINSEFISDHNLKIFVKINDLKQNTTSYSHSTLFYY